MPNPGRRILNEAVCWHAGNVWFFTIAESAKKTTWSTFLTGLKGTVTREFCLVRGQIIDLSVSELWQLNGPCHKILNPRCWSNNSIPGPLIIWRNSVTVLHTYQAPLFIQNANPQQKRKQITIYATDKIAILLKKGLIDSNDYTVSKLKKEVNCQIHVFFSFYK